MEHFSFTQRVSPHKVEKFLGFAENYPTLSKQVNIHIDSHRGGNVALTDIISHSINNLKLNGCQIIISGRLFVSSLFNIFLLGDKRIITNESIGIIHLPVFVEGYIKKYGDDEKLEQLRQKAINFVSSKTILTNQQVRELNEKKLNAEQLMKYGIATNLVKNFEPLIYS